MLKKINIACLTIMLSALPLCANSSHNKQPYNQSSARGHSSSGNNECKNDFEELKHTIEHAISERLKGLESELAKIFCDRNEFIRHRIAALAICLKEFIACQQRSTNANLKDFIACQFNKTEERIQEDIVHKVDCLQELFCKQINTITSDIDKLTCWLTVSLNEMTCLNTQLINFMTLLNDEGEGFPFSGAFDNFDFCLPIDATPDECNNPTTCTTTC